MECILIFQGIELERDPISVKQLLTNTTSKEIHVYSSTIEKEPFDRFIDGIIANGQIETLVLGLNAFDLDDSMVKLFEADTPLSKLVLQRCRPIDAPNMMRVINKSTSLIELDFKNSTFTAETGKTLAESLASNKTITELILGSMYIDVYKALSANTPLRYINLDGAKINKERMKLLAASLKRNTNLEELSLEKCGIPADGFKMLGDGLDGNLCLHSLNLCGNDAFRLDDLNLRNTCLESLHATVMYAPNESKESIDRTIEANESLTVLNVNMSDDQLDQTLQKLSSRELSLA